MNTQAILKAILYLAKKQKLEAKEIIALIKEEIKP
jgi:hypothetical protein